MSKDKKLEEVEKVKVNIEKLRAFEDKDKEKIDLLEGKEHVLEECSKGTIKNINCKKVKEDVKKNIEELRE